MANSDFDSWQARNGLPWEDPKDARRRFESVYGTTSQDTSSNQEDEEDDWFKRWSEESENKRKEAEFNANPDGLDQLYAGFDDAQASAGSAIAGPLSGFLSDYVSEDLGAYTKEYGEDLRDRNLEESAQVAQPKSAEEILAEDPNSWYKYLPDDTPTGHQILRSTPTSLAAAGIALPAALAGGYVAGAAGLAGLHPHSKLQVNPTKELRTIPL